MLKSFENDLGKVSQTAFPNFRCFISSESPLLHNIDIIPEPIVSRRKFGDICRSTKYKFNEGDLQIVQMWYFYGEIMFGGHITDNWDRITNNAYHKTLIKQDYWMAGEKEQTIKTKTTEAMKKKWNKNKNKNNKKGYK